MGAYFLKSKNTRSAIATRDLITSSSAFDSTQQQPVKYVVFSLFKKYVIVAYGVSPLQK